ncbi:hypothetical protein K402DRAFT_406887 [Aulographum hederae CBS 113979]|uniref:Phospholipase D-like domain-containing protein n=1 Tax=Aulographum hederae CBS 113979 TaxID=1176131 RepID=A0A6G1GR57_9PEZI|nr:hypothetical protein K402DRAFT_406887 [Aulographum hederae CBS 113979]
MASPRDANGDFLSEWQQDRTDYSESSTEQQVDEESISDWVQVDENQSSFSTRQMDEGSISEMHQVQANMSSFSAQHMDEQGVSELQQVATDQSGFSTEQVDGEGVFEPQQAHGEHSSSSTVHAVETIGQPHMAQCSCASSKESETQLIHNHASKDNNLLNCLRQEMMSHSLESVDILMAFVKNTGIDELRSCLSTMQNRKVSIRVIGTTYLKLSDKTAFDTLVDHGAQVKIFDEPRSLHGKVWRFKHKNGCLGTTIIGSSNIAKEALIDAIEYNVRIPSSQAHVALAADAEFEKFWNDRRFRSYDPTVPEDAAWLGGALRRGKQPNHKCTCRDCVERVAKDQEDFRLNDEARSRKRKRENSPGITSAKDFPGKSEALHPQAGIGIDDDSPWRKRKRELSSDGPSKRQRDEWVEPNVYGSPPGPPHTLRESPVGMWRRQNSIFDEKYHRSFSKPHEPTAWERLSRAVNSLMPSPGTNSRRSRKQKAKDNYLNMTWDTGEESNLSDGQRRRVEEMYKGAETDQTKLSSAESEDLSRLRKNTLEFIKRLRLLEDSFRRRPIKPARTDGFEENPYIDVLLLELLKYLPEIIACYPAGRYILRTHRDVVLKLSTLRFANLNSNFKVLRDRQGQWYGTTMENSPASSRFRTYRKHGRVQQPLHGFPIISNGHQTAAAKVFGKTLFPYSKAEVDPARSDEDPKIPLCHALSDPWRAIDSWMKEILWNLVDLCKGKDIKHEAPWDPRLYARSHVLYSDENLRSTYAFFKSLRIPNFPED